MKFGITQTASFDVTNKLKILSLMSDCLSKKFASRNYGAGLEVFLAGVNCINPEMLTPPRDFETGFMLDKKYTKSKKKLEFSVKLNHEEVINAAEDKLIDITTAALLKSYSDIESLDIKGFDIGQFYSDLKKLLQERIWRSEPTETSLPQLIKEELTVFSAPEKMPEDSFWEIIERARADSGSHVYDQIELIIDRLSKEEEKEVIGFECTLRELLMRAYHYNVMAVQKIIEGNVTDDSFLYFRCKLILYGRRTFENAISNPNHIFERIDSTTTGEPLLMVADTAFKRKFGDNTDKALPREYGAEIVDYDFGRYKVQGKDWNEEDIPKRYSKLWKAYH